MPFHDRRTRAECAGKSCHTVYDAQRQAVEGMKPFFGVQAGVCLLPPLVIPVKRAMKLRCP